MTSKARLVLGIVVAAIAAIGTVAVSEAISHKLLDFPEFTEATKDTYVATMAASAKLAVIFGWALAAIIGAFVGTKISQPRHLVITAVVSSVLVISIILNAVLIPHPIWMIALGIVTVLGMAGLGSRLAIRT